jgi:hypothetical protein
VINRGDGPDHAGEIGLNDAAVFIDVYTPPRRMYILAAVVVTRALMKVNTLRDDRGPIQKVTTEATGSGVGTVCVLYNVLSIELRLSLPPLE